MNKLFYSILFLFAIQAKLISQSITFNPGNIKSLSGEHHGVSYVNIYNTCTDPVCFDNVTNLMPRLIRFPSAGDADNYIMNFDSMGYGINFVAAANYFADRYNSIQNPLTFGPFTSYTAPIQFDPNSVPLLYNASVPSVFTTTAAASGYTNELLTWYNTYRKQQTQILTSYLVEFKKHIKRVEDSLQSGEKVNVIFVANLFSGTPSTLRKTLEQLTSNSITPVNVVGIEMSNESWGKKNNDMFPDGNAFYNYITGSLSYNGCLTLKGNFIDTLRTRFPNIKIGLPTAPLGPNYYGCNFASNTQTMFTNWNTQLAAKINNTIAVTVNMTPTVATTFDAFVIHNYFDDKYWANSQEGLGNTCNNCLYNAVGVQQYKNYLRAHTTASTNFNQSYSFYPNAEDDTLKSSFDCQLNETFKFIDSGFVNNFIIGYKNLLGINNSNNKKIWMTEWNLLDDGNDDTTSLYHNTFNQAVLALGWKMAMYQANWKDNNALNLFQYSTFFNDVAVSHSGLISKRTANLTGNAGDGNSVDAGSSYVKRMAYWTTLMTRKISLDSLNWIGNILSNINPNSNLRFYSFLNQTNSSLYLYFINAGDFDFNLNIDSLKYTGKYFDTTAYKESFNVRNNYSSEGFAEFYQENKYYKIGNNWLQPLDHEPNTNFAKTTISAKHQILKRKSVGFLKLQMHNLVGIKESTISKENITLLFPNPSSGIVNVISKEQIMIGDIQVIDILGSIVKSTSVNSKEIKLNLNDLSNGTYFIQIKCAENTFTHKLILIK